MVVQAIDGGLYTSLSASAVSKKGNFNYEKGFEVNAKIAAAGIVEPDLAPIHGGIRGFFLFCFPA